MKNTFIYDIIRYKALLKSLQKSAHRALASILLYLVWPFFYERKIIDNNFQIYMSSGNIMLIVRII